MGLRRGCAALVLGILGWLAAAAAHGQGLEYVQENYTKYEFRIPMRDGKRLFTSVYVPKDTSKKYPFLLSRTPYSCRPYGVDVYRNDLGPSALFGKAGYIFVYQDVRGRWMSEGEFVNMRPHRADKKGATEIDESTDTWDTLEWLTKNVANHNGKVGMWGISYPGFYTAAGMIDAHPSLVAASPQAPVTDWFVGDDWHHNGALILPHVFNFMASFGRPRPEPTKKFNFVFDHETPDGYEFFLRMGPIANANEKHFKNDVAFWNEIMTHGTYDEFWQAKNIRPHLKNIKPAVMTVGGWFDAENLFGALEVFRKVETTAGNNTNMLVMGPWSHGGWGGSRPGDVLGDVNFRAKTAEFYRENIELPFFEKFLKGVEFQPPKAWVFETGTNVWKRYDAWPPKAAQPRTLFFHAGGRLSFDPPTSGTASATGPTGGDFDEYVSDPNRPVPFQDKIAIGMSPEYMVEDQRHAARRPDVLVYQTEPLESDVTLVGPLQARLTVSTTGTDSDWIVKLIDVYPDDHPDPKENPTKVRLGGYQQLVRGDVMRGKFRNSLSKPEPFTPSKPTAVDFTLQDTCHTFRSGHRIMIQVHSTWFPLVDRNPQQFVDIYTAKASDFVKATQRVYRSGGAASRVEVLVGK